jgi:glyceraldehyde 3-phosphate dehydrogenase
MTTVVDGTLVKVMAWYDNEWGFTHRSASKLSSFMSS